MMDDTLQMTAIQCCIHPSISSFFIVVANEMNIQYSISNNNDNDSDDDDDDDDDDDTTPETALEI